MRVQAEKRKGSAPPPAEPHRERSILSRHLEPLRLIRHPASREEQTQGRKSPFLLRQLQKDKDLELTGTSYLLGKLDSEKCKRKGVTTQKMLWGSTMQQML